VVALSLAVLASITLGKDEKADQPSMEAIPNRLGKIDGEPSTYVHKVGNFWSRVTNWGMFGDRQFNEPSGDWPGGSGNSYIYEAGLWVGALVDGQGVVSCADEFDFDPGAPVSVDTSEKAISVEDTYCTYNDLNPKNHQNPHVPIGVEVTERTYAWDSSYNDDFIICDYTIRNIGVDDNKDGIPDRQRSLEGVYIGFWQDFDVSSIVVDSKLWDKDDLVGYDPDYKTEYFYDGDSPTVPGDDTGNPDPQTGQLRSPGYVGGRLLDATPPVGWPAGQPVRPTSYTITWRYADLSANGPQYAALSKGTFDPPKVHGEENDFRSFVGVGPYRLEPGDSIRATVAWVIGYGLEGLRANSTWAQRMYDSGYKGNPTPPPAPNYTIANRVSPQGKPEIVLNWDASVESIPDGFTGVVDFDGYAVYRSTREDAQGQPLWDTLAVYARFDPTQKFARFNPTWPPPKNPQGLYEFVDDDVITGEIYTYAVTAFDTGFVSVGIQPLEASVGKGRPSTKVYMSNNPPTNSLDRISVVPNPYLGSARWNNPNPTESEPWIDRLRFENLPPDAKITIFTLDGDLVKEIHSGEIVFHDRDIPTLEGNFSGVAEWDLVSRNNQDIVSGVYLYVVESSYGKKVGKFVIVR